MADKDTSVARRQEQRPASRSQSSWTEDPFRMMQRFSDEMQRVFGGIGSGRRSLFQPFWRTEGTPWSPEIDVFQRGGELVVKADLPGLRKEDVTVEITEDAVTIEGERRSDFEEERDGVYRSERSYGSFCRVIPLPAGAISDQAKARFRDGVLEVTIPAPPEHARRGRRIELTEEKG